MTITSDQTNLKPQSNAGKALPNLASLSIAGKTLMVPLRPFNVDEYYALGQIGILHEDDHSELINGVISVVHVDPSDPSVRTVTYGDTNTTLPILLRLFTTEEYERMIEAGILSEDERCQLIDGVIVEMSQSAADM